MKDIHEFARALLEQGISGREVRNILLERGYAEQLVAAELQHESVFGRLSGLFRSRLGLFSRSYGKQVVVGAIVIIFFLILFSLLLRLTVPPAPEQFAVVMKQQPVVQQFIDRNPLFQQSVKKVAGLDQKKKEYPVIYGDLEGAVYQVEYVKEGRGVTCFVSDNVVRKCFNAVGIGLS